MGSPSMSDVRTTAPVRLWTASGRESRVIRRELTAVFGHGCHLSAVESTLAPSRTSRAATSTSVVSACGSTTVSTGSLLATTLRARNAAPSAAMRATAITARRLDFMCITRHAEQRDCPVSCDHCESSKVNLWLIDRTTPQPDVPCADDHLDSSAIHSVCG